MQKSVKYVGYQLTTNGIGPQPKKIEAMERVLPPQNSKQLKKFLGMNNFYRDVFKRRSHILSPLNYLAAAITKQKTGGQKKPKIVFKMLKVHLEAFKQAKEIIMTEAKLAFPDFSKPFHLYTDASDIQLDAPLVQDVKPLRFYTRKLNKAQQSYTAGEKELLGIVEGSKKENNGSQRIKGTNKLFWIKKQQVPTNKTATYARVIVNKRPEKVEVNQTRKILGGEQLEFQNDTSTEPAGLKNNIDGIQ